MSNRLNIDVEALRGIRAERTQKIVLGAERHRRIKGNVVMNDRAHAIMDHASSSLRPSPFPSSPGRGKAS